MSAAIVYGGSNLFFESLFLAVEFSFKSHDSYKETMAERKKKFLFYPLSRVPSKVL